MKLFFGGVRGGYPVSDPAFQAVGMDTTSILIVGETGEAIIIDAGTGLRGAFRQLTTWLPGLRTVLLCCSHFHLDHVAGLPTFRAWYDAAWTVEAASRIIGELTIEDVVTSMIQPPWWPLTLDQLPATKRFRILDDESLQAPSAYGGLTLRWCPLEHPGGSTAFRIDEPASGQGIVFASDLEWALTDETQRDLLRSLCAQPEPATLLLFDGQYDQANYEAHRGWGHSTWQEGIALAQATGVPAVKLTHHAPHLSDADAAAHEQRIQAVWPAASLARQGDIWPATT